ncbi:MAG: TetR/AcrR family transcriptional regulator, partial [Mesorhizobium sp.]
MIMIAPQDEAAPGNIKVTRQDWIKLALEILISDGIESVRV